MAGICRANKTAVAVRAAVNRNITYRPKLSQAGNGKRLHKERQTRLSPRSGLGCREALGSIPSTEKQ